MNAITYQPLTLRAQRSGAKLGKVRRTRTDGEGYRLIDVAVSRTINKYYIVRVRPMGESGPFVTAGTLERRGTSWVIHCYDAESKPSNQTYYEGGTLADNAERVVHTFLSDVEYREREAAKTPEQREAEAKEHAEQANAARNQYIAADAQGLLDTLDALVPSSTAHYAVEDARKALETLIREAKKASIKTVPAQRP